MTDEESTVADPHEPVPRTIHEAAQLLRSGAISSVELTRCAFARADAFDGELGVYLQRFEDSALNAASRADELLDQGKDLGPLHGVPVGIKDILTTREGDTTAQSLVRLPSQNVSEDATAVHRLREAGAVITGKVTTQEFAIGLPDPSKPFPVPRNPWDPRAWTGGSSSGSASGVASAMFLGALGSDTAGSIRIPSAFCGTTGLKPTFGLVPTTGCVPLAYSMDHVGPMARSARDCAVMLDVISGLNRFDESSRDARTASTESLEGVRVGVVREGHFPEGSDPGLDARFTAALDCLTSLGADLVEVVLPSYETASVAVYTTLMAEAFNIHRGTLVSSWNDYFAHSREFFASGALVPAVDYIQAQRVRSAAQRELAKLFQRIDVIVTPTASTAALAFGDDGAIDIERMNTHVFTYYWNAVGNPVLAMPIGLGADFLPLSIQVAGRPFEDSMVLRVGAAFQHITRWHLEPPPVGRQTRSQLRAAVNASARSSAATRAEGAVVASVLEGAGLLGISDADVGRAASAYPALRARWNSMYSIPANLESPPAQIFGAVQQ